MPRLSPTLTTLNKQILIILTALLFLWPKYVVFGPSLSPFTITVIISIFMIFFNVFIKNINRNSLNLSAFITIAMFLTSFISRFISDISSTTILSSIYFDMRDLMWGGSLFFIAVSLGVYQNTLERVSKTICYCSVLIVLICLFEALYRQSFPAFILSNFPIKLDGQFISMLTTDKTRDFTFRSQGVFSHPIVLGEVSAAMFPVALNTFFNMRNNRIISLIAVISCIIAAILSGSRSAQIALICSVIFYIFLIIISSRSRVVWATSMILLPIILLVVFYAYNSISELAAGRSSTEQQSSAMRDLMWERGWSAIISSPLIGHGGGNSAELGGIVARYGGTYTIDDYYLSALLDAGIIGLTFFFLFICSLVTGSLNGTASKRERRARMGFLAGIFAILVGQKAASITEGMAFVYFYAGLLTASQSYKRNGPQISARPTLPDRLP